MIDIWVWIHKPKLVIRLRVYFEKLKEFICLHRRKCQIFIVDINALYKRILCIVTLHFLDIELSSVLNNFFFIKQQKTKFSIWKLFILQYIYYKPLIITQSFQMNYSNTSAGESRCYRCYFRWFGKCSSITMVGVECGSGYFGQW